MSREFVEVKIQLDPTVADQFPDGLTIVGCRIDDQFAVTPEWAQQSGFSGNWQVTHIPTGRTLGGRAGTCIECAARAAWVAVRSGVDWAKPLEELRADKTALAVRRKVDVIQYECSNDRTCTRAGSDG